MGELSGWAKTGILGVLGAVTHGTALTFFGVDAVGAVANHVIPPTTTYAGELWSATKKLFGSLFSGVKLPLPRICPLP